jgi:YHS domain-containing protein
MSWLAQNWIWVVVAIAVGWFFLRSSGAHGHAGGLGGLGGHAGHGGVGGLLGSPGGHHGTREEQPGSVAPANAPDAAIDAVSGEAVRTAQALSSVYLDKIYYFASKENRERFEAAPQEYAHKVAGHPVRPAEPVYERPRRRSGCC